MIEASMLVLAQNSGSGAAVAGAAFGIVFILFYLAIVVFAIASGWKVYTKAGQPGWAVIVPIYNMYIMCKIIGRPVWWIILMFIPIVSLVIAIIMCIDLAKSFGKGTGFGVGLALLGIIFFPILAWGDAQYQGPAAATGG